MERFPYDTVGQEVRQNVGRVLLAADHLQLQPLHHSILQPQELHLHVAQSPHTAPESHGFRGTSVHAQANTHRPAQVRREGLDAEGFRGRLHYGVVLIRIDMAGVA